MLDVRLPRWNDWLEENDIHEGFEMGIGLNSGPFMSGNIGTAERLAYTAIGDTINTCSRIESLTKETPYMLHVAESTHNLLRPEQQEKLVYIDELSIRGRTTKMKLWGMGLSPVPEVPATSLRAERDEDAVLG
jgi:adenylate cyclase